MANESKFLKWQDQDSDGLIDVCDDIIEEEADICLNCSPNPTAINPDWKKKNIDEPFLNERTCEYQITVVTPYTTVVNADLLANESENSAEIIESLNERYEEFVDDAIESILVFYEKDDSGSARETVKEAIDYRKYSLDPRPHSRLKLLYSVPFDTIFELGPAEPDEVEEEEPEPGEMVVTYNGGDVSTKMIRIRKGLNLYARYLKVYRAIDGGNLFFKSGPMEGKVFNLEDYGDSTLFTNSIMSNLLDSLESWLNSKNINLPGVGGLIFNAEKVTKLEMTFNNYKLLKMLVWTDECSEKPKVYSGKKLKGLIMQPSWRDPTAVAYFVQLYQMETSLSARVQMPWEEFIIKYTYPEIYSSLKTEAEEESQTTMSCIAGALEDEAKELGQDILDDVFDLGDAIAYQFRKSICRADSDEVREDKVQIGLVYDPETNTRQNIFAMAQMQALKELNESDQIFTQMCARTLANIFPFGPAQKKLDQMYEFGFERIKACGLFDLLLDALKCLMGGLTFEEAMASMIKSALKAMSIENFGDLFVGIPEEKQMQLDALVKSKLESGDIFPPDSTNQQISNIMASKTSYSKPWEIQAVIDQERMNRVEGAYEGSASPPAAYSQEAAGASTATRRTLAQQFDIAGAAQDELDPSVVMEAYVAALIEVYSDNFLALLDELNKFPGAQIIGAIIASFDCPIPPLFNPDLLSFIKDIELPFCRNMAELRTLRMENPFRWIPSIKDILKNLWEAIKLAVEQLIMLIILKLMVKICEIIGDAICKALEVTGKLATAVPAVMQGSTTFSEVVRDSICGPDADGQQVEDTIVDLMASLGAGAAALSNRDQVLQFTQDLSGATTRSELMEAFLGNPSQDLIEIGTQLLEFEYPELAAAMPTPQSFGRFLGNCGNLMPGDFRQQMREMLDTLPENDMLPANPTLCATPEQLENFNELRCTLLEGRASKEQCEQMLADNRNDILDDLETLGDVLQGGIPNYIASNMPPIISQPGCDDGLFPHMPEEMAEAGSSALKNDLEMLKIDFAKDMLGNGGLFAGDDDWGFMNMVLSDTEGNPLTAHWRKSFNMNSYVNFATNVSNGGSAAAGFWSFAQGNAGFSQQHGQFPTYVGSWLMRQFLVAGESENMPPATSGRATDGSDNMTHGFATDLAESMIFESKNNLLPAKNYYVSFDDLNFDTFFGGGIDLFMLPDFGYNTKLDADLANEQVVVKRLPRKGVSGGEGADITLKYRDNAAGYRSFPRNEGTPTNPHYSYGFNVQMYLSDLAEVEEEYEYKVRDYTPEELEELSVVSATDLGVTAVATRGTGIYASRPDDNARIKIVEYVNQRSSIPSPEAELITREPWIIEMIPIPDWLGMVPVLGWAIAGLFGLINVIFSGLAALAGALFVPEEEKSVIKNRRYEFLAVDDAMVLDDMDLSKYPNFGACFEQTREHIPQVSLLTDMLNDSGYETFEGNVKPVYDEFMTLLFKTFSREIGENTTGWQYGAKYDSLTAEDTDYLIPEGQPGEGMMYSDATPIYDDEDGGWREAENDDMLLGVSRNQYRVGEADARVIYLDPTRYGGSHTSPPIYVKPMQYEGWLGLVDVLFPEYTPCKPHNTDIVDFGQIQDRITDLYSKIPDDPRLKSDPDCAVEMPYNRILDRPAKAGMAGVIEAAIRIYATVHFFKSIGTFSKVMPRFPDNCSSLYSQYIVEVMEEGFKDAQSSFWEFFTPFKDEEFWYAFLEQSVQYYAWRVDEGEIEAPDSVLEALKRLNDVQENYNFPWDEDLWHAKLTDEAGELQTLKGYRGDKNLETVKASEEDAKLVLKELVNEQLTFMGEKLITNLRKQGFHPTIFDLDYWLFANMCAGGEGLSFGSPDFVEQMVDLPTEGTDWYSPGAQFRIAIADDPESLGVGEEYVGYFHVRENELGETEYVAGEQPSGDPQDILRPIANLIKVGTMHDSKVTESDDVGEYTKTESVWAGIGDIADYTTATTGDLPFKLEKYISINGTKYDTITALDAIKSNPEGTLISEAYPGDMKEVVGEALDPTAPLPVVGIEGELGVRYGLQFYYNHGGQPVPITSVEVDALDLPVEAIAPLDADSHLLLCLLKLLKEDQKFKLMVKYIFPLPKIVATLAIYNDMAFVSSIGEVTVGYKDHMAQVKLMDTEDPALLPIASMRAVASKGEEPEANQFFSHENVKKKPGAIGYVMTNRDRTAKVPSPWDQEKMIEQKVEEFAGFDIRGNEGWQSYIDRQPGLFGGAFVLEWDNWDRILLRNSKSRIKKIFRAYYNARHFSTGADEGAKSGALFIKNLKARIVPSPGGGILSWWQRGKLRPNPYNAEGKLCDKSD
jgi:hypothetical protein